MRVVRTNRAKPRLMCVRVPAIKVPPSPGPSDRSANMRAIRRRDTGPEREIRSRLHRGGLRFRVDYSIPLESETTKRARPDIVFTRRRLAVFIDGCFWHACPEHGRNPTKNEQYWSPKIARNVQRDREQTMALEREGWKVLRIWAHTPPPQAVELIERKLRT